MAADPSSIKKVKLLCSFGGKILPRPSDGALRYAGGHTRILSLRRNSLVSDLFRKVNEIHGPPVAIKYQLPDEDLDALISISSPEDYENMMEEFDRLNEISPDGTARLRIFLFSPSDLADSDVIDTGQSYIDAVNGVGAGIRRKDSTVSASSNEGMSPGMQSPTASVSQDQSKLGFLGENVLGEPRETLISSQFLNPPVSFFTIAQPQPYIPPIYVNTASIQHGQGKLEPFLEENLRGGRFELVSGDHQNVGMASQVPNSKPNQGKLELFSEENQCGGGRVDQSYNSKSFRQPLNQLPPLHPSYAPSPMPKELRLDDCQMCQKALPHAHSDTLINEHGNRNGNGNGLVSSSIPDPSPVLHSHHSEDPMKLQASLRADSAVDPRADTMANYGFAKTTGTLHAHENDRGDFQNSEAFEQAKVLPPQGTIGFPSEPSRLQPPHRLVTGPSTDSLAEPKVEPTTTYGFTTQTPEMHNQHDKERRGNLNASGLIGLTGDIRASQGVFVNHPIPLQHYPHNLGPLHSPYNQDAIPKQFGSEVSSVKHMNVSAAEVSSHDLAPQFSYNYGRAIDGMMENIHASQFEASGFNEQWRPFIAANFGAPMCYIPGNPPLVAESNHTTRMQVGGNPVIVGNSFANPGTVSEGNSTRPNTQLPPASRDLKPEHLPQVAENNPPPQPQLGTNAGYLGNTFISYGRVPEGNFGRPINQMLPSMLDFSHLQNPHPSETSQASVKMGSHAPLFAYNQEVRVEPEVSNDKLLGMPAYSHGVDPAFNNNNVINKAPIGDWKDEASWFHPKDVFNEKAAPLSGNGSSLYSISSSTSGHMDQFQAPVYSDSLFCNQDPRKILGTMHMVPARTNTMSSNEFVVPKDVSSENPLVNTRSSDKTAHLEEGTFHNPQNSMNQDSCLDPARLAQGSGEEHNKQEMQALAEKVVASILQPSVPPASAFYSRERKESEFQPNKERGLVDSKTNSPSATALGDHKIEDIKTKQSNRTNQGFPITDDIGRLQIIKNGDLEELRELGSGTFGTVYHGKWRGSDVAIKRINDRCFAGKPSEEERMRADFWNEACKLADLHHPNVVAFYGVVLDGPGGSFATVTEYMVNGSLRHALQRNDKTLDRRKRLLIAMDVAFGMEYLHGKNIVHFDLKSDNLLVNLRDPQRPICKVADLGLSKVKCQTLISGGVRGTLPWMAPELLNGSSSLVSEKVDVFSFGIVMWELLTGEEPYADLHYGAIIGGIVSNTLRPQVPETCDPEWRSLMEKCWSSDPSERPGFTEIASRLRSMAGSVPQKG